MKQVWQSVSDFREHEGYWPREFACAYLLLVFIWSFQSWPCRSCVRDSKSIEGLCLFTSCPQFTSYHHVTIMSPSCYHPWVFPPSPFHTALQQAPGFARHSLLLRPSPWFPWRDHAHITDESIGWITYSMRWRWISIIRFNHQSSEVVTSLNNGRCT